MTYNPQPVTITSTPMIKSATSPEVVQAIQEIEDRADKCYETLALLNVHRTVAAWALMIRGIEMIEAEIAQRGDNSPALEATLINIGRLTPIAINWVAEHGNASVTTVSRRWTEDLATKATQALDMAAHYDHFVTCFPMWHKDRCLADLVSPELVRFTVPGDSRNRQVAAYMKGMRPRSGPFRTPRASKPSKIPKIYSALFQIVLDGALSTGPLSFEYDDSKVLWGELLPEYEARARGIARRADDLVLGDYMLGEFNKVYGAFLSICAAHEYLCFVWGRTYGYPLESAVMVRSNDNWVSILSELSGVELRKCSCIVDDLTFTLGQSDDLTFTLGQSDDLTFTLGQSRDLHVHPFIPLDDGSSRMLAVAPQFPLHSRPDENILRVVSTKRRAIFDETSRSKEPESLSELRRRLPNRNILGPISMPNPTPNVDMLIVDETSSTLVFAELKWMRKSLRPVEKIDKDAEVLKGITQLQQIREFLTSHPTHLTGLGKLARQVVDYEHVYWLIVARDHLLWMEVTDGIALVEFEALATALSWSDDLNCVVEQLLTYDWLPVEGRDFRVQYDGVTVNGVQQQSEVFYALQTELASTS